MDDDKPQPKPRDIAIVSGPTEDGQGARVIRIREGEVSAGEIRPVKEGESITHSEVVRLRPTEAHPQICEVEVLHAPQTAAKPGADTGGAGDATKADAIPRRARVSTPEYRKNWSAIFEPKRKRRTKAEWSLN
jgi:hypothetical protein